MKKKIFAQPVLKVVHMRNNIIATSETLKLGSGTQPLSADVGGRDGWDDEDW